jgi:hypothetical protein
MSRGFFVVTTMDTGGKRVNLLLVNEAFDSAAPMGAFQLTCTADDKEFLTLRAQPPSVRKAGRRLYEALAQNKFIEMLFLATEQPAPDESYPLFVRLDTPDAEALPWEALCTPGPSHFRALDPNVRWPITRVAVPPRRPEPLVRVIGKELRLAVVLGAAGVSGVNEWTSISNAIATFPSPVELLILVSEPAARTAIQETQAQWQASGSLHHIEVEYIEDSTLVPRLRAHLPNLVHFFCHGFADVTPLLELETLTDRRARRDRGSISIGSAHLDALCRRKSLWAIVLNCCQGARAAPQLYSMARELVIAGTPTVVAMRESVEVIDANVFTQEFYAKLLPQLAQQFRKRSLGTTPEAFDEMIWVRAVHYARQALVHMNPDTCAAWTYPVVYVHRDKLTLEARDLHPLTPDERLRITSELDLLRTLRATLEFNLGSTEVKQQRTGLDDQITALEQQIAV